MRKKKVVFVGISGPSSSGKSTLARLLCSIFPGSFILHQDDFYQPDKEIPIDEDSGLANWDCAESLDFPAFVKAMQYIRGHKGQFPPGLESKEDQNELGESGVSDEIVKMMADEMVNSSLMKRKDEDIVLCLVDGFLLYLRDDVIRELGIRLLIRAPYEKLKERREARSGYVTLDGFWQDPPGYFDKIVWKWYVEDHKQLFEEGDVHGPLRENGMDLQTPARMDLNMQELLMWAIGVITNHLQDS